MSKRFLAAATLAAVSAIAAASMMVSAHAQAGLKTYTDPQGRFTLQHPSNWPVDPLSGSTEANQGVVIGIADAECKVIASRSDQSLGKPVAAVQAAYQTSIGQASWKVKADAFAIWDRRGTVTAAGVETGGAWPVQTAEFTTDDGKPGYARLQARPGMEVWMFCNSFDSRDRKAIFDQIFSSFAGANDAALQAEVDAAAAARAATEAANAATAAANAANAQKQKKKR